RVLESLCGAHGRSGLGSASRERDAAHAPTACAQPCDAALRIPDEDDLAHEPGPGGEDVAADRPQLDGAVPYVAQAQLALFERRSILSLELVAPVEPGVLREVWGPGAGELERDSLAPLLGLWLLPRPDYDPLLACLVREAQFDVHRLHHESFAC